MVHNFSYTYDLAGNRVTFRRPSRRRTIMLTTAAALAGTRIGNSLLNSNRYFRIGPDRMPANGPLPASTNAPRISIGPGPGNPHIDLRVRGID